MNSRRLLIATSASVAVILGTPYIGQLRNLIFQAFPGRFVALIGGGIALAVAIALVIAFWRIRDRKTARYGAIATSLTVAVVYSWFARTGNPAVDVVERFHFVEYGLITWLYWRAWEPIRDRTRLLLPVLAGLMVATIEEGLQWVIPARVGELHDIFLNLWAIIAGMLFSIGLDPPARFERAIARRSWRFIAAATIAFLLLLTAFIDAVHLGHRIDDPVAGAFRSRYRAEELHLIARQRAEYWKRHPPLSWARFSREDQYMTEGVMRVQRRNEAWLAADYVTAWHENLILERYFAPVLDTPSYVSSTGHRWIPGHRADAERFYVPPPQRYESRAEQPPIYTWSRTAVWTLSVAISVLIGLAALKTR